MHDSMNQLDGASGMFNARSEVYPPRREYFLSHDELPPVKSEIPESYDLRDRLRQKSSRQEVRFATPMPSTEFNSHVISEYGGPSQHSEDRTREEYSRGDFHPLPKYRKFSQKEQPISIGQDMTSIFDQTLEESGLSSEQRIFKLVSRLKTRAVKYSLDDRQVQLLVAKFLDEIIKEKNWTSMTVEKALLLCATVGDQVETKVEPCDFLQCNECAIGYPSGKYQCMCGEKFLHLSFLQAHKLMAHNMPPPVSEIFFCELCEIGFRNSVRDLAIHIRSRHMCPYEHIECPHQCGLLIVERSVSSVRDHVARKHQCSVCHDALGTDAGRHKRTFHNVPQELMHLSDAVTKISSTDVETFLNRPGNRERQQITQDTPESPPREESRIRGAVSSSRVKNEARENNDVSLPLIPLKHEDLSGEQLQSVARSSKKPKKVCIFISCASCGLRTPFGAYKCRDCSETFVYRFQLLEHLREAHGNLAVFTLFCEICGFLCDDPKSLSKHVKERHSCSSKHLQCAYGCDKFMTSIEHVALHNDECHEFFCNLCKKVVAVIDKRDHIKNCGRISQATTCDQNVEENLTARCELCSFQCPQGMGFACDCCLQDPNSPALHEFVDEIELLHHKLLHHKEKSHPARSMTISCVLCPSPGDDAFDVFSFIHHRKAVHSICEIHIRCPNKPCDKIMPIKAPATADHVNSACEFKKDLNTFEQVNLHNPSWKACRTCSFVGFISYMSFCDLCPGEVTFVNTTERFLHMFRNHGYGETQSMTCALCRMNFASLREFDVHRSTHHKFCHHHFLCPSNQNCNFLFGSFDQADHHAKNDNFCAIQLSYGRKNRSKFCNSCAGLFKIQFIAVCYFCDSRPTFISNEDYLCHLLQVHGRRVAGFFQCNECGEKFEDPKLLADHSTTTHGRCNMHQFCRNSIECHTLFSRSGHDNDHPCNYEPNLPKIGYPEPMISARETPSYSSKESQPASRGMLATPVMTPPSVYPIPPPFPPPLLPPFIPKAAPVLTPNLTSTRRGISKAESAQTRASGSIPPMTRSELKRERGEVSPERRQRSPGRRHHSPVRNRSSPDRRTFPERKDAKSRLGNKGKSPRRNTEIVARNDDILPISSLVKAASERIENDKKKVEEGKDCSSGAIENYKKLAAKAQMVSFCRSCSYATDIVAKDRKKLTCGFCLKMFHQKFELEYHQTTEHGDTSPGVQLYSGCDACKFAEQCGHAPSDVFIQGTAAELVKHRLDVHGIKIHWICDREDCTVLLDEGNSRRFEEHLANKSGFLCASVFNVMKIPQPCVSPKGRSVLSLKEVMRVCVIFTCSDCNGNFFIYDTELGRLFQRCKNCMTPHFFNCFERNYHFVKKHKNYKGKDTFIPCADCPPEAGKKDLVTIMEHRKEYHGFCLQHFICPMKGCFFMTSKPNRFYWEHRKNCQGGQRPPKLTEKTEILMKHFCEPVSIDDFLPSCPWGAMLEIEYPSPEEIDQMDEVGHEDPASAGTFISHEDVSGNMITNRRADNDCPGTSAMKSEPCWDDMMTNMLQYTDELMQ